MSVSAIKKYYNNVRTDYGINSMRRKKILALTDLSGLSNKRILDLGCASGYLAKELKRDDNFVVGMDLSDKSIAEISGVIDEAMVFNVEEDVWPEKFIHNKFDLIIAAELVEHLFDVDGFFQSIKSVLRLDGCLIISTPNFLLWNNRLRMLLGQYGDKEVLYDKGHIHLMSYNGLQQKISDNGFMVVVQDNIWYPNKLEKWHKFLSPNLFVFQSIIKIKIKQ